MDKKDMEPVEIKDIFSPGDTGKSLIDPETGIPYIAEATDDNDYDYRQDYVSEDDIARENGFYVDDDGHWQELDDDDDLCW